MIRVVVDTNVFVSALLSRRGASYRILELVGKSRFTLCLSVPLVIEYEDAANRVLSRTSISPQDLSNILDYLCLVGDRRRIHYLWRPFLPDSRDDMVLELAVAGECELIVTFNVKDFEGTDLFGVKAITPIEFLRLIGE